MTNKLRPSLTSGLLKTARLRTMQNGLPPILKAAPAVALVAGSVVASATGGRNVAEERMLGLTEGVILLGGPTGVSLVVGGRRRVMGSQGARALCVRCGGVDLPRMHKSNRLKWEDLMIKGLVLDGRHEQTHGCLGGKGRW
ncbi:hypothetical protein NLU13_8640 [Sarocladium strictum]|uniref:Uncharacterized protein n=1 Tax=Sarocladium strictum TaxID=5046 RepID=A0AA39GCS2_SARSR|nr:hypothetical protein NLU13_8640 [Sarocladium strictum]